MGNTQRRAVGWGDGSPVGAARAGALRLFLLLMLCVGSAQSINAGIKCAIQAPRPYVLHLTAAAGVAPADFYARSAAERREWVRRHVASQPGWLGDHWARETGFAFPLAMGCLSQPG
ncbi:hypothetical protein O0544_16750 [Edwardsiella anguillarum]|nr:hypothetical protein [Edwardsiella anguillarum]